MNQFLILAFLFSAGCILGWTLEVFYRRFSPANPERKWINPGFLTGPYLPIYGFGLCVLYLLAGIEETALMQEAAWGGKLILFLTMALVMTLLEYIAGLIFIKGMKIRLWDYSKEKFNLQGIICLRFSFYWALLGAFYYFIIHTRILEALRWFSENLTFSFAIGMFYGVFFVDLVYSLDIVAKIRHFAIENQILVRYEELKREIRRTAEERKEKTRFLLSFKSAVPLKEHLARYRDLHKAFEVGPREIIDGIQDDLKAALEEGKEALREKKENLSEKLR